MENKTYDFLYGQGKKSIALETKRIIKVVETTAFPAIKDIKAAVLEAVNNPIGCAPLEQLVKPGQKIVFICNDPTRVANSFAFMPVLVNELNQKGIKDEDMTIVFALGTHRLMTHEEMTEAVGPEVAGRIRMVNSDAKAKENFDYFGTTSRGTPVWINKELCRADLIIMTGSIVHHYFSGYGGGRKAILPGCALWETIRHNHSFMLDERAGLGKTIGNPVYEDQMEGTALFAKTHNLFLFNAVLDVHHNFLKIFAGDYIKAHREACKFVDQVYGVEIPQEADIVIASCGGYPKDINVYQMQKTMDNAQLAVRKGGVVIVVAECIEGSGSKVLEDTCRTLKNATAIRQELEEHFEIGANKAYAITRLMKKADYILVTALDKQMAKEMLFAGAVDTIEEALVMAIKKVGPDYNLILMPSGGLTVPHLK
jgi:nickel-dependent lactate racemase